MNFKIDQNFVIYSATRSDNRNYCLDQLKLVDDDLMNVQDWRKNTQDCMFYQNPIAQAYDIDHASFTTSPDESENWLVYHEMLDSFND